MANRLANEPLRASRLAVTTALWSAVQEEASRPAQTSVRAPARASTLVPRLPWKVRSKARSLASQQKSPSPKTGAYLPTWSRLGESNR